MRLGPDCAFVVVSFCPNLRILCAFCITLHFSLLRGSPILSAPKWAFCIEFTMFWCSSFAFAACIFMPYKHNITSVGTAIFHLWRAICGISPCVLLHFTLRFAAFCTAFCCILHCVLLHFALLFTAKAQLFYIVCVFMQYSTGQHTVVCSTHFYLNNPLKYSIFCGRVAGWMILMPLFVLNFVLKR